MSPKSTVAQTPESVNVNVDMVLDEATLGRLLRKWVWAGTEGPLEVFALRRTRVFAILRQCFYLLQDANVDPMEYREALVKLGAIVPKDEEASDA